MQAKQNLTIDEWLDKIEEGLTLAGSPSKSALPVEMQHDEIQQYQQFCYFLQLVANELYWRRHDHG